MKHVLYISLVLIAICYTTFSQAQHRMSFNKIPLNEKIHVELLGADKELLHCYNLYGFSYSTLTDSATAEFVVPKDADTFANLYETDIKLCQIKEFAIMAGGKCRHIKVERGVQLKYPNMVDEVFLNFDPDGPAPVFIPCK